MTKSLYANHLITEQSHRNESSISDEKCDQDTYIHLYILGLWYTFNKTRNKSANEKLRNFTQNKKETQNLRQNTISTTEKIKDEAMVENGSVSGNGY